MVASFHSPLNITLATMAPLGWILNGKTIYSQYVNLIILLSRTPIFYINGSSLSVFNFLNLIDTTDIIFNAFYEKAADYKKIDKTYQELFQYLLKPNNNKYTTENEKLSVNIGATEEQNAYYTATYSDGQFTGLTSPQANDYYKDIENLNITSDFNNSSFLKCLLQITMLGIAYSNNNKYTLDNACVIVSKDKKGFKFTGKYWRRSFDNLTTTKTTSEIIADLKNRITNDPKINEKIEQEIGVKMPADTIAAEKIGWTIKDELNYPTGVALLLYTRVTFAKRLFTCTLGLEDYDKMNLALAFSGILGHSWDNLLRFFKLQTNSAIEKEIGYLKQKGLNWNFLKHIGTPLASYMYDYKTISEQQILGGYNSVNFNKILNAGILRIRDNVRGTSIYTPQKLPNCLFPITFSNLLLTCETKCYRSYRQLLRLMKTRKQRNLLFDNLSQYGRRCMTVLDPYGIFMHFKKPDWIDKFEYDPNDTDNNNDTNDLPNNENDERLKNTLEELLKKKRKRPEPKPPDINPQPNPDLDFNDKKWDLNDDDIELQDPDTGEVISRKKKKKPQPDKIDIDITPADWDYEYTEKDLELFGFKKEKQENKEIYYSTT